MHPLLTLCARAQPSSHSPASAGSHALRTVWEPEEQEKLAQQVNTVNNWPEVLAQANTHGLGPLLYFHLKAAGVTLPPEIKRELAGLYMRHHHANRVRAQVAAEILAAFQAEGISALALKGFALAHLLYPEPALRPMSDIDLLVKPAQARQAQEILAELGFNAPPPPPGRLPGKHLANATRHADGLTISVELHHNLFNLGHPHSLELAELTAPPVPFALGELTAYTLPYEEMLWHLCQHLTIIGQPFRLIWLADIVGLAERFAPAIDWPRVERNYPEVLSALSLFHFITPLSEQLRRAAALRIGPAPAGIGQEFQGWPARSIRQQRARGKGYGRILGDTFWPAEWWLRLYYGLGSARPLFWYRWLIHPLRVLGWAGQLVARRLGRKRTADGGP